MHPRPTASLVLVFVASLATRHGDAAMPAHTVRAAVGTRREPTPTHATPSRATTLSVTVNPSGVVSVDNGREMDSPVVGLHVAPGRHTVRVSNREHTTQRVTHITVHAGQGFALIIDLE